MGHASVAAPRPTGAAAIGRLTGLGSAILAPIFLFLAQITGDGESIKGWEFYQRIDIIVLLLCVGTAAVVYASFVSVKPGLPAISAALQLGCFALILAFPLEALTAEDSEASIGIGAILGALITLIGAAGNMYAAALPQKAVIGAAIGAGRGASALHRQPSAPSGAPQPIQQSGPAPGWYDDPNRQARLRYFDGVNWTDQTSN